MRISLPDFGKKFNRPQLENTDSATGPCPLAEAVYTNYDVYLSGSVAPSERSLTFATNVVHTLSAP